MAEEQQPREKKIQTPVTQGASIRKKTIFNRFVEDFIKVDFKLLKDHIHKSAVSYIKQAISEIVRNGVDMILYGENAPDRYYDNRSPLASRVNFINYSSFSDPKKKKSLPIRNFASETYDYGEVIVQNLDAANSVIAKIDQIIASDYGEASVADLYDAAGIDDFSTSDTRYGWSDFGSARPVPLLDGTGRYVIKTPPAELLRRD